MSWHCLNFRVHLTFFTDLLIICWILSWQTFSHFLKSPSKIFAKYMFKTCVCVCVVHVTLPSWISHPLYVQSLCSTLLLCKTTGLSLTCYIVLVTLPVAETCLQQSTFLCRILSKKSCVTKFRREEERTSSTVSSQFWKDVEEDHSSSRPGRPARNNGGMETIPGWGVQYINKLNTFQKYWYL